VELSNFRITFTKDLRLPTLHLHHHSSSSSAATLYMLNYLSAVIKILTTRVEHLQISERSCTVAAQRRCTC